jgi:myosin heavy subunit
MMTLRSTRSHFVRCIKPNLKQEPRNFMSEQVLQQLLDSLWPGC